MTNTATLASIGYFGKIPSRGDFVKSADGMPLVSMLDDWLAKTMDLLSADPRWKLNYDAVRPLHFAFFGPRRRYAIAGHLVASSDQAHRRFPFLTVSSIEVGTPSEFAVRSPMVLSRLWNKLETHTVNVMTAEDPTGSLHELAATQIRLEVGTIAYDAAFTDFLDMQTLGALDALLAQTQFRGSSRQMILALGLLLQPVMTSNSSRLDKSLMLPLPADPIHRYLVASYWMHLITPFLLRADFELSMFLTHMDKKPVLVLGFNGASARTLQAIMDPGIANEHHISFHNAEWIEDQINADYGVRKLSTYLEQPSLSLKSAYDSFREAFIGA